MKKWITNIYDPKDVEGAKRGLVLSYEEWREINGREKAWKRHLKWLEGKTIGEPEPSDEMNVRQMKAAHLVGVYVEEE